MLAVHIHIEKLRQLFSALTREEQEHWLCLLEQAQRAEAAGRRARAPFAKESYRAPGGTGADRSRR